MSIDLEREVETLEKHPNVAGIIKNFEWDEDFNNYQIKDAVMSGNIFNAIEAQNDQPILSGFRYGWIARAEVSQKKIDKLNAKIKSLEEKLKEK